MTPRDQQLLTALAVLGELTVGRSVVRGYLVHVSSSAARRLARVGLVCLTAKRVSLTAQGRARSLEVTRAR